MNQNPSLVSFLMCMHLTKDWTEKYKACVGLQGENWSDFIALLITHNTHRGRTYGLTELNGRPRWYRMKSGDSDDG